MYRLATMPSIAVRDGQTDRWHYDANSQSWSCGKSANNWGKY